jgi:hypothetical protein
MKSVPPASAGGPKFKPHVECLIHPLTQVVLTSFTLIQRVTALPVKVAKTFSLNEIEAGASHPAQ